MKLLMVGSWVGSLPFWKEGKPIETLQVEGKRFPKSELPKGSLLHCSAYYFLAGEEEAGRLTDTGRAVVVASGENALSDWQAIQERAG